MGQVNNNGGILNMKINIDSELIHKFRDKVNEEEFFRVKFRNIDNKNHWNIICSAMDWISIAAVGLPSISLEPKGSGYDHLETLNLMQYIITIDILAESIIQLYRVLDSKQPYPLIDDNEIFKHDKLSDDKYFKHVRAVFSTHPVNLDSLDGIKTGNGERFFASWVASVRFSGFDYVVSLYSNKPEKDDQYSLGLNIKDIYLYAEKRYNLLKSLIHKVEAYNEQHIKYYKEQSIAVESDLLKKLYILLEENNKRFGELHAYSSSINYMIKISNINVDSYHFGKHFTSLFNDYKKNILLGIPKINEGLQTMSRNIYSVPFRGIGYEFEKILSFINDSEHPIGKEYFEGLITFEKLPSELLEINNMWLNRFMLDALLYNLTNDSGEERISLNKIVPMKYPN
jgi:hypothetical protein